jgi:hypothetical protein
MRAELSCMVEKFPGLTDKILVLYDANEEFQTLCSDYLLCLKSLDQWVRSLEKDEMFVQEYSELEKILEAELVQYIKSHTNKK